MNLYLYFAAPAISSYSLPGPVRKQGRNVLYAIRNSGAPLSLQEQKIRRLLKELHALWGKDGKAGSTASLQAETAENESLQLLEKAQQEAKQFSLQDHGLLRSLSDFFLVVPLWIGGVEGLAGTVLEQKSWMAPMNIGFSTLLQGVVVWIVIKLLARSMCLDLEGWKRWLVFGGLFISYLLGMKWASILPGSVQIPALGVILACGSIFLFAFICIKAIFEPERRIRHVS